MSTFPEWPLLEPVSAERFRLAEPYLYQWSKDGTTYQITVPTGFVHNMASTPKAIWWLIGPFDLGPAATVHDYGYHYGGRFPIGEVKKLADVWVDLPDPWSRREVDRLFGRMMRESRVAKWRRRMAYRAVRWFGRRAWGK